jgi:hypothetical protein
MVIKKDSTIKHWVKLSGLQAVMEVGVPLVCYLHYMLTIIIRRSMPSLYAYHCLHLPPTCKFGQSVHPIMHIGIWWDL